MKKSTKNVNIYNLELHQGIWDKNQEVYIYRVASGWIYSIGSSHVFVPYSDHFNKNKSADLNI